MRNAFVCEYFNDKVFIPKKKKNKSDRKKLEVKSTFFLSLSRLQSLDIFVSFQFFFLCLFAYFGLAWLADEIEKVRRIKQRERDTECDEGTERK